MCINNCFFKILLENFDTKIYFTKLVCNIDFCWLCYIHGPNLRCHLSFITKILARIHQVRFHPNS